MAPALQRMSEGKPTILLLPNFGADSRAWGEFADALAPRFGITSVTWSGHGEAPAPSSRVDLIDEARDAASQLDDEPAGVVAAGKAAGSAVQLAHDGLVPAITLLGAGSGQPVPEANVDYGAVLQQRFAPYTGLAEAYQITDDQQRRQTMASIMADALKQDLPAHDVARLQVMFESTIDLVMDASIQPVDNPPWIDRLHNMNVRLQVIAPATDETSTSIATALAARAPRGQVDYLDTHISEFMWLARPQQAAHIVTAFVNP